MFHPLSLASPAAAAAVHDEYGPQLLALNESVESVSMARSSRPGVDVGTWLQDTYPA